MDVYKLNRVTFHSKRFQEIQYLLDCEYFDIIKAIKSITGSGSLKKSNDNKLRLNNLLAQSSILLQSIYVDRKVFNKIITIPSQIYNPLRNYTIDVFGEVTLRTIGEIDFIDSRIFRFKSKDNSYSVIIDNEVNNIDTGWISEKMFNSEPELFSSEFKFRCSDTIPSNYIGTIHTKDDGYVDYAKGYIDVVPLTSKELARLNNEFSIYINNRKEN